MEYEEGLDFIMHASQAPAPLAFPESITAAAGQRSSTSCPPMGAESPHAQSAGFTGLAVDLGVPFAEIGNYQIPDNGLKLQTSVFCHDDTTSR
jgi:hypothetical protein